VPRPDQANAKSPKQSHKKSSKKGKNKKSIGTTTTTTANASHPDGDGRGGGDASHVTPAREPVRPVVASAAATTLPADSPPASTPNGRHARLVSILAPAATAREMAAVAATDDQAGAVLAEEPAPAWDENLASGSSDDVAASFRPMADFTAERAAFITDQLIIQEGPWNPEDLYNHSHRGRGRSQSWNC
jgi:hypothetical protein